MMFWSGLSYASSLMRCRSQQERTKARQDPVTRSILSRARDDATIYTARDNASIRPPSTIRSSDTSIGDLSYEADLASSEAYQAAFASMMSKTRGSGEPATELRDIEGSLKDPSVADSKTSIGSSTLRSADSNSYHSSRFIMPLGNQKRLSQQLGNVAFQGNTQRGRELLAAGANIDFRDDNKKTALYRAVENKKVETVQMLLEHAPRADLGDEKGRPPLTKAVMVGDRALVELLLHYNADVNAKDRNGSAALHFATQDCKPEIAAHLLEMGADPDVQNNWGLRPLHYCGISGDAETAGLLADLGADLNATRQMRARLSNPFLAPSQSVKENDTPLHTAIKSGSVAVVQQLVEAGANMEARYRKHRSTALGLAVYQLEHLKDVQDRESRTQELEAMIQIMVKHGADVKKVHRNVNRSANVKGLLNGESPQRGETTSPSRSNRSGSSRDRQEHSGRPVSQPQVTEKDSPRTRRKPLPRPFETGYSADSHRRSTKTTNAMPSSKSPPSRTRIPAEPPFPPSRSPQHDTYPYSSYSTSRSGRRYHETSPGGVEDAFLTGTQPYNAPSPPTSPQSEDYGAAQRPRRRTRMPTATSDVDLPARTSSDANSY